MRERATDAFDQELVNNTHPEERPNPRATGRYNLVVLGAGTAGLVCAAGAAGLGARVALIEKHRLGGDCLNYGCVPSKALLRCTRAAQEARRAGDFGVRTGAVDVDFPAILARMRRLRAAISRHDSVDRFTRLGVDVFFGEARFSGPDTVTVSGQTLSFTRAVIATGSRPVVPSLPGLEPGACLTNETVFSLAELPRRLVVLGGGPIGCELAQAFRRFGSEVHLVQRAGRLLPRDEPEAAEVVRRRFAQEGIQVYLQANAVEVGSEGEQRFCRVQQEGRSLRLSFDVLLVAVGRQPNVEDLGLEAAGVAFDARGVCVNDWLQTTNRRIYAAGDVCSPHRFTHAADAMARLVLRNALFFGRQRASRLVIPWCTYTDPEVAHIGLTVEQAAEQGLAIRSFRVPLEDVDRAVLDGETEGFAVAHVREGSDRLVGATVVAAHAGETVGELALAVTEGLGLAALSRTIHPYPTVAEVLRKLGDAWQRSRLTPRKAWLLRRLLQWRR